MLIKKITKETATPAGCHCLPDSTTSNYKKYGPIKPKPRQEVGLEKGEQIKIQKNRKSVTFLADYGRQLNFICV